MRAGILIWPLMAALVSGCDPGGLRRVQLNLRTAPIQGGSVALDSPDIQDALKFLDSVVTNHNFYLSTDLPDKSSPGSVRVYSFSRPPVTVDGHVYTRNIPCHVRLTSNGLDVTFGEFGFLAGNPEAESLFVDVRTAFIKRYGKKNVRSHKFGDG